MNQSRFLVKQASYSCRKLAFLFGSLAIALSLCSTGSALEGWTAADVTLTADGVLGATDGPSAMHLNGLTPGFKNDVGFSGNIVSGPVFDALNIAANAIAGGSTDVKLEFDLAVDNTLVTVDGFAQLGLFVNSTGLGFRQYGTGAFLGGNASSTFPVMTGAALTDGATIVNSGGNQYHVAVPMGPTVALNIGPGTFFQIGFKSNGGWTGTMDLGIDDMRVTGTGVGDIQLYTWVPDPVFIEETIFSWETPDDPNTPVNEQLENWTEGFDAGHVHNISTLGATDGSSSLQIDRQSLTSPNFTWGSQFELSSDIDPDPNSVVIDPTLQGIIDGLVDSINGAHSIAFDVRFDDSFPNTPTFTKFGVHFSDDQGTFFDAEGTSFNGSPAIGTTGTVTIPLSSLFDGGTGQTLDVAGLAVGTNFLRIGVSSNTDGAGIYQIDNFRVISEVLSESADFDGDGFITGSDFLIWQRNLGLTGQTNNSNGDANGDGIVNNDDLDVWENQYGTAAPLSAAVAAVPEPSAWMLAMIGCAILLRRGQLS